MTQPIPRDAIYRRRVFDAEVIELCVRWHITYRLSYRDLVELMAERGVQVAHTTILRWVLRYVPEYEKHWSRFSKPVGTSWRVDETYASIRGRWHYLYRAVDKQGKTIDFLLRPDRGIAAALAFFRKALGTVAPRVPRKMRWMATARAVVRCGCFDASTRAGVTCGFGPVATSTTSLSRIIAPSSADVPRWQASSHSPRPRSRSPGLSSPPHSEKAVQVNRAHRRFGRRTLKEQSALALA
jgi:transposase-like protein